ncbi:MAG: iron-sulfur cluster repair di-iron protein [Bryobacteraceae bacterium]
MQTIENITVAEIAANSLTAVRVFERLGIDYCCGGKRPLTAVCLQKGYDVATVRNELDEAEKATRETARDWSTTPLQELIAHIVGTHHAYLYRELPALSARLEKVCRVYNQRHGETLPGLPEVFAHLRSELEMHMRKEEMVLFPAIAAHKPFASIGNPIAAMEEEHEAAGEALAKIREITKEFSNPEYACVTYRALMSGLQELEQDLHLHIHLENNILFPRAMRQEAA